MALSCSELQKAQHMFVPLPILGSMCPSTKVYNSSSKVIESVLAVLVLLYLVATVLRTQHSNFSDQRNEPNMEGTQSGLQNYRSQVGEQQIQIVLTSWQQNLEQALRIADYNMAGMIVLLVFNLTAFGYHYYLIVACLAGTLFMLFLTFKTTFAGWHVELIWSTLMLSLTVNYFLVSKLPYAQ